MGNGKWGIGLLYVILAFYQHDQVINNNLALCYLLSTLYSLPHSPLPISYSLFPTPYFLLPIPHSLFPTPYFPLHLFQPLI